MTVGRLVDGNAKARFGFGLALTALLLAPPRAASAQTPEEREKAHLLWQEALREDAAGNCPAALIKYRGVAAVKMTTQVMFNIATCEEKLEKLVSALGDYNLAASLAGTDKKAQDVAARIPERVTGLEERIPKLTITRGKNAATAIIELDGAELGPAKISKETPLDPGAHTIVAKVGDKEVLRGTVTLIEKDAKVFEVNIESTRQAAAPGVVGKNEVPTFEQEQPKEPPKPPSKVPAIATFAAGGAALVVGGVFLGLRAGALSTLSTQCGPSNVCPPSSKSTVDSGRLDTGVAEVAVVLGVGGIVAGVVLLVKASPPPPPPKQAAFMTARTTPKVELVGWAPGASVGGMSLVGSF